MNQKLPNEGELKPRKFTILSHRLEAGDTWNFHAPCTLTFIRQEQYEEGLALTFEVSDLKYEYPEDDSQLEDVNEITQ
mgnify:CR=1 FL=1